MLEIIPLKAFKNIYIWTLRDGRCAAMVDPGEAHPVIAPRCNPGTGR